MAEKIITYVPEGERKGGSLFGYILVAFVTLLIHHWWQPHGARIEAPVGTTIELTRTTSGWIVEQRDARGNVIVYDTKSVRINAQNRQ